MPAKNIVIIGSGLIGGSVALALHSKKDKYEITCLDKPERLGPIKKSGCAKTVDDVKNLEKHIPQADIVILAAPVDAIIALLEKIAPHLSEGAIATDVGSAKQKIAQAAEKHIPKHAHFIAGHPMTGANKSTFEAADPLLFRNKIFFLCPDENPETPLLQIMELVEDLGASPFIITAKEHDRLMAHVSHAPHLVALALMDFAKNADKSHGILHQVAGGSFIDLTRIVDSDVDMWKPILEANKGNIAEAMDLFLHSLEKIRIAFENGESAEIWEELAGARRRMEFEGKSGQTLRQEIDKIDQQIITLLAKRFRAVEKIGKEKAASNKPVSDPEREKILLEHWRSTGRRLNLPPDSIDKIFQTILDESKKLQSKISRD